MSEKEKAYLALELEEEEELVDIGEEPEPKPLNGFLFKDDKYYWVAELPMGKCFFLLFEVWKVLGISALIVGLINLAMSLTAGGGLESFIFMVGMTALVFTILLILSLPAYYIVTKANNGKYTVLFEMDDEGIDHIQIKTDKAKALDVLTALAGAITSNHTLRGLGAMNSEGASLYSSFNKVRKIKANKNKGLISLHGRFISNQVYVDAENFDFVYEFIKVRCPDARIT